jgi:hypothetical protein
VQLILLKKPTESLRLSPALSLYPMPPLHPRYTIRAGRLTLILAAIASCLVIINCGIIFLRATFDIQRFLGFSRLFDLDKESNFPSLFSTGLFLINSGLLFCIASIQPGARIRSARLSWLVLSVIFGLLAIDECISIHEMLVVVVRNALNVGGVFHFAWVIPYGVATLGLAVVLTPWFLRLDRRTQSFFGGSAVLFLAGSVGLEMVAGRYLESVSLERDVVYQVMYTIEETLEMCGLILFGYSLMDYLRRNQGVSLSLDIERNGVFTRSRTASKEAVSPETH